MIDAVVFDLDGTLLDSLEDLGASMNAALGRLGFAGRPARTYRDDIGDGVEMFARRALPAGHDAPETLARLLRAMREEYAQRWADRSRLYPGIPELLDALVERALKLAILSNKPDPFTRQIGAHFFDRWPFAVVRGALPGVPKKPDPQAASAVLAALDVAAERTLFVGDTAADIGTALAAKMIPVGVLWGYREASELRRAGARELITHPRELLSLLRPCDR